LQPAPAGPGRPKPSQNAAVDRWGTFAEITGNGAAGLIGLLFVAISVAPREGRGVIQQVRASSALLAFTNALTVSLFGLVPGSSVGYVALVVGVVGVLFTAASVRSIAASPDVSRRRAWRQAGLVLALLAVFSVEIASGIGLITNHTAAFGPESLSNILIGLLLIGIARAWELVGNRDTGILASILVLTGLDHAPLARADSGDGEADDSASE
jgi:hypothetical protein